MRRYFPFDFKEGMSIAKKGFAKGVYRIANGLERMTASCGHWEYREGYIPHFVLDPVLLTDTMGTVAPKAFDIKSIDNDGLLTITRCFWQVQANYYSHADISLTATTGTVCAVLDTTTGTLTAAMDYVWTPSAPELVPYALYEIIVSTVNEGLETEKQVVRITCDRRGSAIQFHG